MRRQRPVRVAVVMAVAMMVAVAVMVVVVVTRMAVAVSIGRGVHERNVIVLHFALSIDKTMEFPSGPRR